MFPCFELGSIPCELKWINKVYKLGKVGCRSPIDPGAKKKKKKKKKKRDTNWERWFYKTGIRLKIRLKTSRNICDQLLDMHLTQK